ncbi:MAG: hypothetical protein PHS65_06355 [Arcobacteraceae bacterium]|nr:hypothetical protein [Arcobacteraceae bacterium]
MFQRVDLSMDYKDLEIVKSALENEIESLENQNFAGVEDENINEHKQVLKKINIHIEKLVKESF